SLCKGCRTPVLGVAASRFRTPSVPRCCTATVGRRSAHPGPEASRRAGKAEAGLEVDPALVDFGTRSPPGTTDACIHDGTPARLLESRIAAPGDGRRTARQVSATRTPTPSRTGSTVDASVSHVQPGTGPGR